MATIASHYYSSEMSMNYTLVRSQVFDSHEPVHLGKSGTIADENCVTPCHTVDRKHFLIIFNAVA